MDDNEALINKDTDISSDENIACSAHNKAKWRSIRICYLVMFFSSMSYSIQMPSIWPYMTKINKNYTKAFLGWVIAVYSIGQFGACPVFAAASGKLNRFRSMLLLSCVIGLLGNFLYTIIKDIPDYSINQAVVLLISRILIGVAGGNVAAVRLFISMATTEEERLVPMTTVSACQAIGFIIGPGLQAVFVLIGYPGFIDIPFLRINMYTVSAFFNIVFNVLQIFLLIFWFSENFLKEGENSIESESSKSSSENQYVLAIFMLMTFFFCMMSLSIIEAEATPLIMDNFAWSANKATLIISILLAVSGILSLVVFAMIRFLTKCFRESTLLVVAFILIELSIVSLIPYGNDHMPIAEENILPMNNSHLPDVPSNSTGCNMKQQPWCYDVPPLKYWQFGTSLAFFTLGYPTGNIMSYVIFSRLLNSNTQSWWMGMLTSGGSLARTVGPIFITNLYVHFGTQIAFGTWGGLILLFLLTLPYFLLRMHQLQLSVNRDPTAIN